MNPIMALGMMGGGMGAVGAGQMGAQQPQPQKPNRMDQIMGFLGSPQAAVAMSLLESGGWQPQRVSTGQALARAGMAGANAMQMQQKLELDKQAAALKAQETLAKTDELGTRSERNRAQAGTAGQYTLTPGSERRDKDGNLIASVPSKDSPLSTIGRLASDLADGKITEEEYKLAIQNMAPRGMRMTMNPDGTFTFEEGAGVTGGDPRTQSQRGADEQGWMDRQREDERRVDELLRGLGTIKDFPNVTGARGAVGELGAGVLGAVSPSAGDAFSKAATGVDSQTLGQLRTRLRTNVGPMIRLVRDDSSGRYTLKDRELAEDLDASLDVVKNAQQAQGAYKEMIAMMLRGTAREARQRGAPLPSHMDVLTDEGIERFGSRLEEYGFSPDEVEEQIIELRRIAGAR
jgi:hypothetical protein